MINKKSKFFLTILITALLTLVACGDSEDDTKDQDNTSKGNNEEATESYVVEHAMGETTIKGTPKRIVVLTNHGTEALLSLGIKPVGAVQSWVGDPWYDHIADQMEGVQVVGTESSISLEQIAALEPDLILANKQRQEEHYESLNAIAPTVFEEALRGDWKINFELIAEAVNKKEEGEQVLAEYQARVDEIRNKLEEANLLDTEVSLVRFLPSDVRIYWKDTFSGIILDEIGLKRPEAQDIDDFAAMGVTMERINEMDGDVIFYFTYNPEGEDGYATTNQWVESDLWKNLSAVQAGKAYEVDDTIWNTAGGVIAAKLMLDDLESKLLNE